VTAVGGRDGTVARHTQPGDQLHRQNPAILATRHYHVPVIIIIVIIKV